MGFTLIKTTIKVHVPPLPEEAVRVWVERFITERTGPGAGDKPTRIDFDAHGVFPFVEFNKLETDSNHVASRQYVNDLLAASFDKDNYYVTPDLRVWFTNSEQALVFKLCFHR
jgi:hypothetical protein